MVPFLEYKQEILITFPLLPKSVLISLKLLLDAEYDDGSYLATLTFTTL